jgi:DNA-binding transcriptional LysR family regulator
MEKSMETRYLETLLTTVESGSFSRTAELLHLTQSGVSQRIKFLEDHFGQVLLERGAQLRPTPAGEVVVAHARDIVASMRTLKQQMELFSGGKRLALCCTPTFGMVFLPEVLNDFMQRNSDIADFKFSFQQPEEALRGLQARQFDLAIIEHCDDIESSGIEKIDLQQDELVFVSAPQLGIPAGVTELERLLPFRIYARRDGCSSKKLLMRNLENAGRSIDDFSGVLVSDDLRLTLLEIVAGRGISFLSLSLAEEFLRRGELLLHRVDGFSHYRHRSLLVNKDLRQAPLILDFIKSIYRIKDWGGICVR